MKQLEGNNIMTNISRRKNEISGNGNLFKDNEAKAPVYYKIDVFQEYIVSGHDEIPGIKRMEFTIQMVDVESDTWKIYSFMDGEIVTLELDDGNTLKIIPYKTGFNNSFLAKLAAGNNAENLKKID